MVELELQKTTTEGKSKHYETQVAALEAQKASLEVLLKTVNEQKMDIEPLTNMPSCSEVKFIRCSFK